MLAEAAVFGLPVERIIHTRDETERSLLQAVVQEASKVVQDLQTNLARKIVHEYSEARKRGEK